jgi:hypothetical protein
MYVNQKEKETIKYYQQKATDRRLYEFLILMKLEYQAG